MGFMRTGTSFGITFLSNRCARTELSAGAGQTQGEKPEFRLRWASSSRAFCCSNCRNLRSIGSIAKLPSRHLSKPLSGEEHFLAAHRGRPCRLSALDRRAIRLTDFLGEGCQRRRSALLRPHSPSIRQHLQTIYDAGTCSVTCAGAEPGTSQFRLKIIPLSLESNSVLSFGRS
jgi:hypothetical protein